MDNCVIALIMCVSYGHTLKDVNPITFNFSLKIAHDVLCWFFLIQSSHSVSILFLENFDSLLRHIHATKTTGNSPRIYSIFQNE